MWNWHPRVAALVEWASMAQAAAGGPVWVHPEEHSGDSDIKNALKRVTFSHLCLTTPPQSRHEGLNCPYALGGWHTLRLQAQLSAISLLQVWAEEEDGVLPPSPLWPSDAHSSVWLLGLHCNTVESLLYSVTHAEAIVVIWSHIKTWGKTKGHQQSPKVLFYCASSSSASKKNALSEHQIELSIEPVSR